MNRSVRIAPASGRSLSKPLMRHATALSPSRNSAGPRPSSPPENSKTGPCFTHPAGLNTIQLPWLPLMHSSTAQ